MNVCHKCGTDNKPLYKFCIKCGGDLPAAGPGGMSNSPMAMPDDRAFLDALADAVQVPAATPVPPVPPLPEQEQVTRPIDVPAPAEAQADVDSSPYYAAPPETSATPTPPNAYELPDLSQLEAAPLEAPSAAPAAFDFHPAADVTSPTGAGASTGSRPCPNCGHMVPNDFAFCGQCGARFDDITANNPLPVVSSSTQGSPRGRLVLVRPDGTEGGAHPLEEGENLIGRGVGALFDSDGYLSPRHADLVLNAAGLVVRDNASLNGVFARIVGEEELNDGDIFRIGQELLRFDAIRAPEPLEDGTEILGSPNPGYWGRLAVIVGPAQDGSAFPLFGDAIVLGREHGDIIFPEDGYVSGTHARVAFRDDRYYLADMNSSNGTFLRVRGERVVPPGTFLLMGQQLFRVAY